MTRRGTWWLGATGALALVLVSALVLWLVGGGPNPPSEPRPRGSSTTDEGSPTDGTSPAGGERVLTHVYTTGYTWFDNTPPGSATISHPQLHRRAGGDGTYDDPITMAVGHSLASGTDELDLPAGTRAYVPHVRRYFIVEDTCGDGRTPQHHGCHDLSGAPDGATLWVDLYVGGDMNDDKRDVQHCAGRVTDGDQELHTVVLDPRPDYPVAGYPVFHDGQCTDLFAP